MWYNHLSEYLINEGYANQPIYSCMLIMKNELRCVILLVYVVDINLYVTIKKIVDQSC